MCNTKPIYSLYNKNIEQILYKDYLIYYING